MTICFQCALKAMVEGKPTPTFAEMPDEHVRRVHPDAAAASRERAELMAQVTPEMLAKQLGQS